jgi:hypothetical protein
VQALVARALADGGGYYRQAARRLAVDDAGYGRFMDFLRHAGCKVDYRSYRD